MRIGVGYDVHPRKEGRPLILGGVHIPAQRGLEGYSDADVLLHAVMDALLGAAGLGDIGQHFPPGDPAYAGADSRLLLKEVGERIRRAGFTVANIDATVIAQEPPLAPHMARMREQIALQLGLSPAQVNIKAKSPEGLGALGQGEGIAAMAAALLQEG